MYRECTDVWAYRHMGMYWGIHMYGDIQGVYRCTGGVQMYGAYRHMEDVQGVTAVWRMYRYRGHTDTPPDIQTARHIPTCLPTTLGYYISYKIYVCSI